MKTLCSVLRLVGRLRPTGMTLGLLLATSALLASLCGCSALRSDEAMGNTQVAEAVAEPEPLELPESTAAHATGGALTPAETIPEPEPTTEPTEPLPEPETTEPEHEPEATKPDPAEPEAPVHSEEPPEEAEPSEAEVPQVHTPFVYHGLVELTAIDNSFVIDQRYATTDNFTGIRQYDRELCLVQEDIVDMLIEANELAKQHGLRLKIWDAYRPISVQQALHDSAPEELAPYVPAPGPYSMHARGITVDLTLCYPDGTELDMPTAFDDFSTAANSDYEGATQEQIANRELLNEIMSAVGFKRSKLEWWHFDGPNRDHYEILDVSFAEFEAARDE